MTNTEAVPVETFTPAQHSWLWELLLRLLGALLQISATWAIVQVLTPDEAGIYFRGFAIALGLSALLRGKYEIYMAQQIIGRRCAPSLGIATGIVLMQLARRMLLRSSLLCGILLVVTADLDIQAPQLQTILQTYLPFVLALPCISLSSLLGEALRAANRTLGLVLAAYAVNVCILIAVILAPPHASLVLYSWAFFLGSVVSAAIAVMVAWRVFPTDHSESARPASPEVLQAVDSRELIGLARGLLLWGPLCILAVWAPALQMAQYAVAARTALVVDFFLPALNLTGCRETLRAMQLMLAPRRVLLGQLARALIYSSAFFVPLLMLAPKTLAIYGRPYDSQLTVYALLLAVQWVNGLGRPAVRHAVIAWNIRRIGFAIGSGAVAVVLLCALGVVPYGAQAAAAASLLGAVIVNARAISMGLSDRNGGASSPDPRPVQISN